MAIRRYGAAPRGPAHRLRPGVYAVIAHRGGVILTLTDEFQLPGGGIDPGEQPLAALRREVLEETGWAIGRPLRLGTFRQFDAVPEGSWSDGAGGLADKICTVYAARAIARRGPPTEPDHRAVVMAPGPALLALGDGGRAFLSRALALGLI